MKCFSNTKLRQNPKWDYKPNIEEIFPNEINLNAIDKTHSNCDCIDG